MRGLIKTKNDESQLAITWLLYSVIDFIVLIATNKALIKAGGYQILFASAIVCLLMSIILFRKKGITWTWLEKGMVILITICIVIWIMKGPSKAVIWGIISESAVGIYLLIKTFKFPVIKYNLLGYILFLLACIISIYDAPNWSLLEIGYPTSEVIITSIIIIPLLRKWYQEKKKQ